MAKKWICDKGCHKQITWPEPYQTGNKPVNMDGSPHNCLVGGPDHVEGQVATAPPTTKPEEEKQSKIDAETPEIPKHLNQEGKKLEDTYVQRRRALSLQVWHLAIHDAGQLVSKESQLQVAQTLYLGMMSNL